MDQKPIQHKGTPTVHIEVPSRNSTSSFGGLSDDTIPVTTSSQRTASWASDDTLGRDEETELLSSKNYYTSTADYEDDESSYIPRPRRRPWLLFLMVSGATILAILLALDILLRVSQISWTDSEKDPDDPIFSRWGADGSGTEDLAWYPTNFLQDVVPKAIHSHNDYWRKVPLFTALRQGCMSVEADVWLFNDPERSNSLYVGHEQAALQPNRTFQSLYIQPLVDILERQNPATPFYNDNYRGVFDMDPNQTLTLLVDVKTSGAETWAKVVEQLEPLRQRDWLTFHANGTTHTRPVTVVGTGNTPFDLLTSNSTYRDYFYDAPLHKLNSADYDATNSYYASVSFGSTIGSPWMGGLGAEQIERIRAQVKAAHERGLKARYWDLPSWPISTRNRLWNLLVQEGVDLLNVDDVKGASKRKWKY